MDFVYNKVKFDQWRQRYPPPYSVIRVCGSTYDWNKNLPYVYDDKVQLQSSPPQNDYIVPSRYQEQVLQLASQSVDRTQSGHLIGARIIYSNIYPRLEVSFVEDATKSIQSKLQTYPSQGYSCTLL
jgi:hypothetical protein